MTTRAKGLISAFAISIAMWGLVIGGAMKLSFHDVDEFTTASTR